MSFVKLEKFYPNQCSYRLRYDHIKEKWFYEHLVDHHYKVLVIAEVNGVKISKRKVVNRSYLLDGGLQFEFPVHGKNNHILMSYFDSTDLSRIVEIESYNEEGLPERLRYLSEYDILMDDPILEFVYIELRD